MNRTKFETIFQSQSNVAKKVYEVVPEGEALEAKEIYRLVRSSGNTFITNRVADGCMRALTNAGLFHEHPTGTFRRTKIHEASKVITKVATGGDDHVKKVLDSAMEVAPVKEEKVVEKVAESAEKPKEDAFYPALAKSWRASLININATNYSSRIDESRIHPMEKSAGGRYQYNVLHDAKPGDVFRCTIDQGESLEATLVRFRYVRCNHSHKVGRLLEIHVFQTYVDIFVTSAICKKREDVPHGLAVNDFSELVSCMERGRIIANHVVPTTQGASSGGLKPGTLIRREPKPTSPSSEAPEVTQEPSLDDAPPSASTEAVEEKPWSKADVAAWKELVIVGLNNNKDITKAMDDADAFMKRYRTIVDLQD